MNLEFYKDFLLNLVSVIRDVFNWFITDINIPILDLTISPINAMFGFGLVALLGVIIVRAFL